MEKAKELWESILPTRKEIRERSINYLKQVTDKAKDKKISFLDEDDDPIGGTSVCVTYDGGNHPEYAANPFSFVYGIYQKDGNLYLHTEDCDEYDINFIDGDEIYGVALYVYEFINPEEHEA